MKYKKTKANKDRAERIAATLEAYGNGDTTDDMVDVVTDLRHYAAQNKINFTEILAVSENHFEVEAEGE